MALFYVTFNLGKRKGYLHLLHRLKYLQARRVLCSVWALEEECTAEWLRDHLSQHIDEGCRLLVIESANSAWFGPILCDPKAAFCGQQ